MGTSLVTAVAAGLKYVPRGAEVLSHDCQWIPGKVGAMTVTCLLDPRWRQLESEITEMACTPTRSICK